VVYFSWFGDGIVSRYTRRQLRYSLEARDRIDRLVHGTSSEVIELGKLTEFVLLRQRRLPQTNNDPLIVGPPQH
jgi:hypothetical protein